MRSSERKWCALAITLVVFGILGLNATQAAQDKKMPPAPTPGAPGKEGMEKRNPPARPGSDEDGEEPGPREPRPAPRTEEEMMKLSETRSAEAFKKLSEKYDANKDGKISRDEHPKGERQFENYDTNKDGFLEANEYVTARVAKEKQRREERKKSRDQGGKRESSVQRLEMRFLELDKNSDGRITAEEEKSFFTEGQSRDINKDGAVTFEEFIFAMNESKEVQDQAFGDLDRDGNGSLSAEEAAEYLKRHPSADLDKNGTISREEFSSQIASDSKLRRNDLMKTPDERFKALDLNKDGTLDPTEAAPFLKQHSKADRDLSNAITREEFNLAIFAVPSRPQMPRTPGKEAIERETDMILGQFDKNKDGRLDAEEAKPALKQYPQFDGNKDGAVDRAEIIGFLEKERQRPAPSPGSLISFENFDRNKDGKTTKEESPNFFKEKTSLDTNGDGEISREEFDAKFGKMREPGRGPGEERPMPPPRKEKEGGK